MIKFTPIINDPDISGKYGEGAAAYSDGQGGLIVFKIAESYVHLIAVEGASGVITEGLVRSALNYAANNGAYTAWTGIDIDGDTAEVLKSLGFEEENGKLIADIPDVLTCGCKGCSK